VTGPGGWDYTEPTDDELRAANDDVLVTPSDATITGSTYGLTDYDNARRVALYEAQNLRYVNDLDDWFTWCTNHWCKATRGDQIGAAVRVALRIAQEAAHVDDDDERGRHAQFAQASLSETRLRAMISVATGVDELRAPYSTFDTRGHLLNFPNCTLNPRTLAWHTHSRDDMLTQICPTPYDVTATSKLLDDFLNRFLPDEKERDYTLQMLAVSALSFGNSARRMILLLGPTSTGKSTLMELVQKTLGHDYTVSINPSVFRGNLDDKPRPDLLRTFKTRLIIAFEASDRWELHTDQIKRMTGGDPMTARAMRSDVMNEVAASFVPIIVANAVPQIHGSDDALRRRLTALVMDTPIAEDEDDGTMRAQLVNDESARRALLARLIRIYHECDGRVTLPIPVRFAERTMEMFAALDDVDEILKQLIEEGSIYPVPEGTATSHFIKVSTLHRCYMLLIERSGSQQQKRERLGIRQFMLRLKSLGYETCRSNGMRVVGWCVGSTSTTLAAQF
jgi:P4 family phage/plasmid primase-like protien